MWLDFLGSSWDGKELSILNIGTAFQIVELSGKTKREFQLALWTSNSQSLLARGKIFFCCYLVGASENKKLVAQKKNLLVMDDPFLSV